VSIRTDIDSPPLRTVNQLAAYLGVTRATVYKLVRGGDLPAVVVGKRLRFRAEDVDAYLEREAAP
jgi:excisionase family DNA binding protein